MTPIRVEGVTKRLGETLAVDGVDLHIRGGELFFLLGPSGSGKSTLLSLIAGLLEPDAGRILMGDRDVTRVATQSRSAVLCFQGYALWPHMSVRDNVAFSLEARRLERHIVDQKVRQALQVVHMSELAVRMPGELSGGQQQRVAIARALAAEPHCLLLDEPLSNLDARLRSEMRAELRRICRETGITTIYVTHDRHEALSLADRIAVLNEGRLEQVGTPQEVFSAPHTRFVAEFLAQSNLIPAEVVAQVPSAVAASGRVGVRLSTPLGELSAFAPSQWARPGRALTLCVRPDQLMVVDPSEPMSSGEMSLRNRLQATAVENWYLGDASEHVLDVSGFLLRVRCVPARVPMPSQLTVEISSQASWLVDEARSDDG